ncbi:MAG: hypothetical protein JNK02_16985 [Planctomycetes bacterium]|nr:hypothetical protein [Planctomycetota bacterium]
MSQPQFLRAGSQRAALRLAAPLLLAGWSPAATGGATSLEPGSVFRFDTTPQAVVGACDGAALGFCNVIQDQTPLRAYAYGVVSAAQAAASVAQHHEFSISAPALVGSRANGVLHAQIAGSVRVRGYLFTMGGATATAGVVLQLLDVTDGADEATLVWSGAISDYRAETRPSFAVGAAASVKVEGGFPYIGAAGGGEVGLEIGISPDLQLIRDAIDFGFPVLVQRGRSYRLQLALDVATHNRILAATSIACFYSSADGAPAVPNTYNPRSSPKKGSENSWLSILTAPSGGKAALFGGRVGNFGLPKGVADLTCGSVLGITRTIWEQGLTNPYNALSSSEENVTQRSDRYLAHLFGLSPGQSVGPVTLADSSFMRVAQDDEEEVLDLPGVHLDALVLTLAEDPAEDVRRAANRAIERQLQSGGALVSSCLPRARGGDLEDVLDLVDRLILDAVAAGLPVNNAALLQALARTEFGNQNYRLAYTRTRAAYLQLTRDL